MITANTFYATAGAIACGAKPLLVDVNDNYQIDETLIEKELQKNKSYNSCLLGWWYSQY